ncbi:MAG: glycosyltransferase family 2 protein [Acidimicrobiales bacterium]
MILPVRGGDLLAGQLAALAAQGWAGEWELVVVDNGLGEAARAALDEFAGRLPMRVVSEPGPASVSAARNRGIAAARGELLVFCDHDDEVAPGWLAAMAEAAVGRHVVGGRMDEERFDPRRRSGRPRLAPGRLPVALGFLPFALGANLGVWRDAAVHLDGFCTEFVGGNDDVEFCFRAQLCGLRLGYAPTAVVAYRHRPDARGLFAQFRAYGRTDPLLYRRFRHAGLRRPGAGAVARRWLRIALGAAAGCAAPARRRRAVYVLAYSVGRIEGSLRHRAVYL